MGCCIKVEPYWNVNVDNTNLLALGTIFLGRQNIYLNRLENQILISNGLK